MLSLLVSIGGFIPGLFGKNLSEKTAKIVGGAILILLLLVVLNVGKCAYDASVINEHEVQYRAQAAEQTLEADREAEAQASATAAAYIQTKADLDQATRDAARAHPTEAAKQVGPVTQSYYDTLRKKENRR